MGHKERKAEGVDLRVIPGGVSPEEALIKREDPIYIDEYALELRLAEEKALQERLGLSPNGGPSAHKF